MTVQINGGQGTYPAEIAMLRLRASIQNVTHMLILHIKS